MKIKEFKGIKNQNEVLICPNNVAVCVLIKLYIYSDNIVNSYYSYINSRNSKPFIYHGGRGEF